MHSHPPRRQTKLGAVRNRRPGRLCGANDNENWAQQSGCGPEDDPWMHVGEAAHMSSKRWWLDE